MITYTAYIASSFHRYCCQQRQQRDPQKKKNVKKTLALTWVDYDNNDVIRRQYFLWSILLMWYIILESHRYYYHHHLCKNNNLDHNNTTYLTTTTILIPSSKYYDWTKSTEENYKSSDRARFCGKYQQERHNLDYSYHSYYNCDRQLLQDEIIDTVLGETLTRLERRPATTSVTLEGGEGHDRNDDSHVNQHWIVFTAGIPGAGKTYTTQRLREENKLPLVRQDYLVSIDPDELRQLLPEYGMYINNVPLKMGEFTQKEVGLLTELITSIALNKKLDVLVDGSLSNYAWYIDYINQLRRTYNNARRSSSNLNVGLIYVTASISTIYQRVEERAKQTGRIVPQYVLNKAIQRIPNSVKQLQQHVDCFIEIENDGSNNDSVMSFNSTLYPLERSPPPTNNNFLLYP